MPRITVDPAARAARSAPAATDEKYGSVMSWTIRVRVEERPRAIACAAALGAYRSSAAEASTRSRRSGLTVRSLLPLMAREAVDNETPAALATSLSVTTGGTLAPNPRYLDIEILSGFQLPPDDAAMRALA